MTTRAITTDGRGLAREIRGPAARPWVLGAMSAGAIGIVLYAFLGGAPSAAQGRTAAPADGLWIEAIAQEHRITLMVADPATRTMAVYHVDPESGALTLRSSRNMSWDLLLGDFNVQDPAPGVIRGMIEKAQPSGLR